MLCEYCKKKLIKLGPSWLKEEKKKNLISVLYFAILKLQRCFLKLKNNE